MQEGWVVVSTVDSSVVFSHVDHQDTAPMTVLGPQNKSLPPPLTLPLEWWFFLCCPLHLFFSIAAGWHHWEVNRQHGGVCVRWCNPGPTCHAGSVLGQGVHLSELTSFPLPLLAWLKTQMASWSSRKSSGQGRNFGFRSGDIYFLNTPNSLPDRSESAWS